MVLERYRKDYQPTTIHPWRGFPLSPLTNLLFKVPVMPKICIICNKLYTAKHNLLKHLDRKHIKHNRKTNTECECGFSSKYPIAVAKHCAEVGGHKLYSCHCCNTSFSSLLSIECHFSSGYCRYYPLTKGPQKNRYDLYLSRKHSGPVFLQEY